MYYYIYSMASIDISYDNCTLHGCCSYYRRKGCITDKNARSEQCVSASISNLFLLLIGRIPKSRKFNNMFSLLACTQAYSHITHTHTHKHDIINKSTNPFSVLLISRVFNIFKYVNWGSHNDTSQSTVCGLS